MNIQSLDLGLIPKFFDLAAKDEALGIEIRISAIAISSKTIHFLIKLVNGYGMLLGLAGQ